MDNVNSVWQVAIIALVAGVMIGILAYRLFGRSTREGDKIQAELDETRDELDQYKASVNEHFNKTSELVNDLTQNYVRVYQHLAEGAHLLGDAEKFDNLLQHHPGKVSLTVDGEAREVDPAAMVDAAPTPEVRVEPPTDFVEATDDSSPADATVSEAAAAPAQADTETASTATAESERETPEATIDAERSDEPDDKKERETTATAASVMPESESETETSRTVH